MNTPKKETHVLLKLKPEIHIKLKKHAALHKRSMQKVMEALVEGWLDAEAPDPIAYGNVSELGQMSITKKQIDALRYLIKQEIDAAQTDGMEHGTWSWAAKELDKKWQEFKDSF